MVVIWLSGERICAKSANHHRFTWGRNLSQRRLLIMFYNQDAVSLCADWSRWSCLYLSGCVAKRNPAYSAPNQGTTRHLPPALPSWRSSGVPTDPHLAWQQRRVWSCGSSETLMCRERWGERMCQSDLEKPAGRGREGGVCRGGGNQRMGGGGERLALAPCIQRIILPRSTSVAKLWQRGLFYLFF